MTFKSRLNKQLDKIQGYDGKRNKDCAYDLTIVCDDKCGHWHCVTFDELKTLIYDFYQSLDSTMLWVSLAQGFDCKMDIYVICIKNI